MTRPTAASSAMRVNVTWPMLAVIGALLAVGGLGAAWHMRMSAIDAQITDTTARLKTLHLGGRLLPTQAVMDYLQTRGAELDRQYDAAVKLMTTAPAGDGPADQQLYFQQRVHEVQSTLSRLAAARKLATPQLLGLPKELPPPDVAPRFLLQLALAQDIAEAVMPMPELTGVTSLKVEDPEPVAAATEEEAFLTRLPVRLRATVTLKGLATMLAAIDRLRPAVDVAAVRMMTPKDTAPAAGEESAAASSSSRPTLEIDCMFVRYILHTAAVSAKKGGGSDARKVAPSDDES